MHHREKDSTYKIKGWDDEFTSSHILASVMTQYFPKKVLQELKEKGMESVLNEAR